MLSKECPLTYYPQYSVTYSSSTTMSAITFKAAILDMDGLMLDTEPIARFAWQEAAALLGYNLSDEFYLTLIGRTDSECENELLKKYGSDFPLDKFRTFKNEQWSKKVESSGINRKPGLEEFLGFLESNGIPFARLLEQVSCPEVVILRQHGFVEFL